MAHFDAGSGRRPPHQGRRFSPREPSVGFSPDSGRTAALPRTAAVGQKRSSLQRSNSTLSRLLDDLVGVSRGARRNVAKMFSGLADQPNVALRSSPLRAGQGLRSRSLGPIWPHVAAYHAAFGANRRRRDVFRLQCASRWPNALPSNRPTPGPCTTSAARRPSLSAS